LKMFLPILAALGVGIAAVRLATPRKIITGPIPAVIPIPAGWRRAAQKEVTKDALAFANWRVKNLGQPGDFVTRETPTGVFGALTEWHYHEPNGPLKPWGWHRGVTILLPK
jgi:hypothetical protein